MTRESKAIISRQPIRILSAGAPKIGVRKCAEVFAAQTGGDFEIEFATAPVLKQRVGGGEANANVVVAPLATMENFSSEGLAEPVGPIGSVTAGVVIRNGGPAPDLSTVESFVAAMLGADSLVYNEASSGQYIASMIDKLCITEQVAVKVVRAKTGSAVMEHLAKDTAANEIGFGPITEIRLKEDLGVHLVGPLPDAVGKVTTYAVAVLVGSPIPESADALAAFMTSADGKEIMVATGVV